MPSNKGTTWETKGALTFKHAYKLYCKGEKNPVSMKVYREVIDACNEEFRRLLIEEGRMMRMPFLSKLKIIKTKKPSKSQINYKKWNEEGIIEKFTNDHSDGYRPRLHWDKHGIPITGVTPYSIKLGREVRVALNTEMNKENGHNKYPELYYGK